MNMESKQKKSYSLEEKTVVSPVKMSSHSFILLPIIVWTFRYCHHIVSSWFIQSVLPIQIFDRKMSSSDTAAKFSFLERVSAAYTERMDRYVQWAWIPGIIALLNLVTWFAWHGCFVVISSLGDLFIIAHQLPHVSWILNLAPC